MATLLSMFGSLLLMSLVVSGLLFMVAPQFGRQLLKKTGAAAGLFFLGFILLQMCCSALRR